MAVTISGVFSLLYHTWVFGSNCDPNLDQTANIEVACFGVEQMRKRVSCLSQSKDEMRPLDASCLKASLCLDINAQIRLPNYEIVQHLIWQM